jgi:hypothetical protein
VQGGPSIAISDDVVSTYRHAREDVEGQTTWITQFFLIRNKRAERFRVYPGERLRETTVEFRALLLKPVRVASHRLFGEKEGSVGYKGG